MTDAPKEGQGKALTAGTITFASVLVAVLLQAHYKADFEALEAAGYPLPFIIAGIAGIMAHIVTWWARADIVGILLIAPILAYKRVAKVWKAPD